MIKHLDSVLLMAATMIAENVEAGSEVGNDQKLHSLEGLEDGRKTPAELAVTALSPRTKEWFPGSVPWLSCCVPPQDLAACIPAAPAPAPAMTERCTAAAWLAD
ncbi:uncharacterized protein LOC144332012 isoform X2 [Macaca mulatta]